MSIKRRIAGLEQAMIEEGLGFAERLIAARERAKRGEARTPLVLQPGASLRARKLHEQMQSARERVLQARQVRSTATFGCQETLRCTRLTTAPFQLR
jgi:hypothetical protein